MLSINSSTIETLNKPSEIKNNYIENTDASSMSIKSNVDQQQSTIEPTTIVISSSSSSSASEIESTQSSLELAHDVIQPQQQQQQQESTTTDTPMEISDSNQGKIVVDSCNQTTISNEINEYKSKSVEIKDKYCWVCHTDDVSFACQTCPRSYHDKCVGQQNEPEDVHNWICMECQKMKQAEEDKKIFSKVNLSQFTIMLDNAVKRLKYHGSEPFQKPVDLTKHTNYLDVVVNPMDLSVMEYKISAKKYNSLEEFLNDIKWIVHNASVFHGVHHKLTGIAKSLHRMLKHEISEMEVCPDCYLHSIIKRDENWFCEPCKIPHPLVWAKMKGFPHWPGKALRIVNGDVDVRFFGQHDRSWVDSNNCFWLSKEAPHKKRSLTTDGFDTSIKELKVHIQRLQEKFGDFIFAPPKRSVVPTEKPFIFVPSLREQVCIQISIDLSKRGKRNIKGFLHSVDSESNQVMSNTESTHIPETKRKKKRRKTRPFSNPKKLKANQQRQRQKFDISIEDSNSSYASGELNSGKRSESKQSTDQITFVSSTESPHAQHDDNDESIIEYDNEANDDDDDDSDEMDTLEPEQLKLSSSNDHNILKTLQTDRIQKQKEAEKSKSPEINAKNEEIQIIPTNSNSTTNTINTTTATKPSSSTTDAVNLSELLKICKTNLGLQNINVSKSYENSSESTSLNDSVQPKEQPKIDIKNNDSESRSSPINSLKSNGRCSLDIITPAMPSSNKTTPTNDNERKRFSDVLKSRFRKEIENLKKDYEEFRREMKYNYELTVKEIIIENHNNRIKIKRTYDDAIEEVKRKQWCSNCLKEAKYYCCWNTSYCNENCQMAHWTVHQNECINTQLDSKMKST